MSKLANGFISKLNRKFADCAVCDLTKQLDSIFYESAATHAERKKEAAEILAELKVRFAETGI